MGPTGLDMVHSWAPCELILVTNPFQVSSSIRVHVLRVSGAKIGSDVVIRPQVRVKFPSKLSAGTRSWIGEGVRIHNQDRVEIGSDHPVAVSQIEFRRGPPDEEGVKPAAVSARHTAEPTSPPCPATYIDASRSTGCGA